MTVIYADILLTINLVVDYLVLFGTARLAGVQFKRIKGLAAAVLGALYSLIIIFALSQAALTVTRFAVSCTMVFISFGKRKITEFIRLLLVFYICSFLFCGFMMLINSFAKTNSFFVKNGVVYFEYSAMGIVLSGTGAFIVTEILRRLFRNNEPEGSFTARVYYNGKSTVLKCFTDTGNELEEPFSGIPVAVAKSESINCILPEKMADEIVESEMSSEYKIKLVPCKTISGTVLIKAFRPDRVVLKNGFGEFEAEEIMIGISEYVPENTLVIGKNIVLKENR